MSKSQSVLGTGRVSYVEFDRNYAHRVTVHLNTDGLGVDELFPLADKAAEKLSDHVAEANPNLGRSATTIVLALRGAGTYGDNYLPEGRREALLKALSPVYTRKVSATARIVRNAAGGHTETRVTVTLSAGDPFKGVNAKQHDGKYGILRARVSPDVHSLVFTMSEPAANDEPAEEGGDGAITKVIKVIADKLNALLVQPVTVKDDNPDAALNPANDYVAPAKAAVTAS